MDSRVTLCAPPAPTTQRACVVSGRPVCVLEVDVLRSMRSPSSLAQGHGLDAALDGAAELGQPVREDLLGPPLRQAALEFPWAARVGGREVGLGCAAAARRRRAARIAGGPRTPRTSSTTPAWARISSVPGWSAVARAWCGAACSRSMTRALTPWRASSTAASSPDGPAPMMSTSVCQPPSPAVTPVCPAFYRQPRSSLREAGPAIIAPAGSPRSAYERGRRPCRPT